MLGNPNKPTKKDQRKQLIRFIVFAVLLFGGLQAKKKWKQVRIRQSVFSGIIIGSEFIGERSGYIYFTNNWV